MSKLFNQGGCVYIMANSYHNVLYTGVTSDLAVRVYEHKNNLYAHSFTAKYKCHKLMYYKVFNFIEEAIAEEKRIKGSNKSYKRDLVNSINAEWKDLYLSLIE